jgi:hypothetical protein
MMLESAMSTAMGLPVPDLTLIEKSPRIGLILGVAGAGTQGIVANNFQKTLESGNGVLPLWKTAALHRNLFAFGNLLAVAPNDGLFTT